MTIKTTMGDNKTNAKLINQVMLLLARQLGVEIDDISLEDTLSDDLRMGPKELADVSEALVNLGYEIGDLDFESVETVADLVDYLALKTDL